MGTNQTPSENKKVLADDKENKMMDETNVINLDATQPGSQV